MGSDVRNPVSHVAYGYATQVCILNEDGTVKKIAAAHDVGKAVNPLSVEGQIEGGVIMSYGFALTEKYPLKDCKPTAKYGTLGLPKADKIPEVEKHYCGETRTECGLWSNRHRGDHINSHSACHSGGIL